MNQTSAATWLTVPCIGKQGMQPAFGKLMGWATSNGMASEDLRMMTVFHDSFRDTAPDQVRMSVGLEVKDRSELTDSFVTMELKSEPCIHGRFELDMEEFAMAWGMMFTKMKEEGLQKSQSDPYEIYLNDFSKHPEQKFIVDLFVPVGVK